MNVAGFLFEIHKDLPFLSLSFVLCALVAWLIKFRSGHLIPAPGRRLAILIVVIHVLLLGIYLIAVLSGTPLLPLTLWHFDEEYTVPSVHSTVQLVLLANLCFLNAMAPGKCRFLKRLYWFAHGVGFTGFSLLEYQTFPKYLVPGGLLMVLFGILVVTSSLIMILRHRTDVVRRFCLLLLPVSLGFWAFAYFLLDYATIWGNTRVEPLEETVEMLGTAFALAGAAGYAAASLPRRRILVPGFLASTCLTNAILLISLLAVPIWEENIFPEARFLWLGIGNRINADIGDGAFALRGWDHTNLEPGKHGRIQVLLQAIRSLDFDFGLSVQLIDQGSGNTTAVTNELSGIKSRKWTPGLGSATILRAHLFVPETAPTNRAQWLTVSFWKNDGDGFPPLPIDSSDYPLLGDTHVILDELVLQGPTGSFGQDDALALFANGFALQRADLPESVQAGETINVEFQWRSNSDGEEDWTQFLHFVPQTGGALWNVDRYPLGLRLPTRLWYAGMQSSERWSFTIPPDLAAGTYRVYTGLYRLADLQRLEVTLAEGQQPDDRSIPLGSVSIEN